MAKLQSIINDNFFQGYAYSYPHKSSYRPFENPLSLKEVWSEENKERLFLYVHVPFCEMRCGFCNLFTIANPKETHESPFIQSLERQATEVKAALGDANFNRLAIGGGTPTFLSTTDLERLFFILEDIMGADLLSIPSSVEMSPKTASVEKLALLKEKGTTRASIGVQSFLLEETKALGRPQQTAEVQQALQTIKDSGIPEMNIDLIYGMAGQTLSSWQYSLEQSIAFQPEEIFLYPLYVRPLTGLGLKEKAWNDHRLNLYRFGRDFLLSKGYEQVTMRIFRNTKAPTMPAPPYNSPEDGMVGLGVGARSYTKKLHYSSEYAVGRKGIKNIIHNYNEKTTEDFQKVLYGTRLSLEEQQRRYVIKSILEGQHLDFAAYYQFFGTNALDDLPELQELYALNLAPKENHKLQLNQTGLELSDVIGPWLYSDQVCTMMQGFELA
ncbi:MULTISPECIES: STM4012 family radical SAM protein [unclassified Aureispira]|uniref:STM4012 family radical SAM protein n=1 Tax=unclassified Aureispira TaxID=2649989 RepID=UPI000697A736|nr:MULTISPECIES: STM4012 family radical SAM protein [unclassified Aureispira]WMX16060.1 STM4012 family radical SAM protein [Aureispira sp. CCB-E]